MRLKPPLPSGFRFAHGFATASRPSRQLTHPPLPKTHCFQIFRNSLNTNPFRDKIGVEIARQNNITSRMGRDTSSVLLFLPTFSASRHSIYRASRNDEFIYRAVSFCVSCLEGRSVRSTERSEARKGAAPLGATPKCGLLDYFCSSNVMSLK